MAQQDVIVSLESAAKASGIAFLNAINAPGGAIDLEADAIAASLGSLGPEVSALAKPFIHQIISSLVAKIG